jgi:hypothetical protein
MIIFYPIILKLGQFFRQTPKRFVKPKICVSARCGPYLFIHPSLYFHRLKSVTIILTDESYKYLNLGE